MKALQLAGEQESQVQSYLLERLIRALPSLEITIRDLERCVTSQAAAASAAAKLWSEDYENICREKGALSSLEITIQDLERCVTSQAAAASAAAKLWSEDYEHICREKGQGDREIQSLKDDLFAARAAFAESREVGERERESLSTELKDYKTAAAQQHRLQQQELEREHEKALELVANVENLQAMHSPCEDMLAACSCQVHQLRTKLAELETLHASERTRLQQALDISQEVCAASTQQIADRDEELERRVAQMIQIKSSNASIIAGFEKAVEEMRLEQALHRKAARTLQSRAEAEAERRIEMCKRVVQRMLRHQLLIAWSMFVNTMRETQHNRETVRKVLSRIMLRTLAVALDCYAGAVQTVLAQREKVAKTIARQKTPGLKRAMEAWAKYLEFMYGERAQEAQELAKQQLEEHEEGVKQVASACKEGVKQVASSISILSERTGKMLATHEILVAKLLEDRGELKQLLRKGCALCGRKQLVLEETNAHLGHSNASLTEAARERSRELSQSRQQLVTAKTELKQCRASEASLQLNLERSREDASHASRQITELKDQVSTLEASHLGLKAAQVQLQKPKP
jgi:hypothetical protein